MNDLLVNVIYRNKQLQPIIEKTYTLEDYCQEIKVNLLRVIADIQDVFYDKQYGRSKQKWSNDDISQFYKIRHKLLDSANQIERLPNNLIGSDSRD